MPEEHIAQSEVVPAAGAEAGLCPLQPPLAMGTAQRLASGTLPAQVSDHRVSTDIFFTRKPAPGTGPLGEPLLRHVCFVFCCSTKHEAVCITCALQA